MILDNVIEKVSGLCCADVGKATETTKPMTSKADNKPTQDVLDETKDEVDTKPVQEEASERTAAISSPVSSDFTAKETKYELVHWKDLPEAASKAATTLGFDQEMWDNDEHAEGFHKHWDDLSEEERKAAETLGWDKVAWETKYEDVEFADIPAHVKRAAQSVGFDEAMWNEDRWPEATDKLWNDLNDSEKGAYAVLGYSKKTWD